MGPRQRVDLDPGNSRQKQAARGGRSTVNISHVSIWKKALAALLATTALSTGASAADSHDAATQTPIKHVVIIFQENSSFDHYFATYPTAANPPGQPQFVAQDDTPTVNGLTAGLLTLNPNGVNPRRLDRVASDVVTCSNDHDYTDEQKGRRRRPDGQFQHTVVRR